MDPQVVVESVDDTPPAAVSADSSAPVAVGSSPSIEEGSLEESSSGAGVEEEEGAMGAGPVVEASTDDGFVHVDAKSSSQKGEAMQALSSIIKSEEEQSKIDGDWVALSSPALKVHALEEPTPASDSSAENSVHTVGAAAAQDHEESRIISFDRLRTTSTDPAQGVDPTKRESYLSDTEFQTLFGMSKMQFYALPKWKQDQRKLNLDLF